MSVVDLNNPAIRLMRDEYRNARVEQIQAEMELNVIESRHRELTEVMHEKSRTANTLLSAIIELAHTDDGAAIETELGQGLWDLARKAGK